MAEVEPGGGGDGGAVEKNAQPSVGTLSAMLQKRKAPEKAVAKRNNYSAAQKAGLAVLNGWWDLVAAGGGVWIITCTW
jgi:hypothetical protein